MTVPALGEPADGSDQRDKTDQYAQQLLAVEQAAVRAVTLQLLFTLAWLRREASGRMLLAQSEAARRAAASFVAQELAARAAPLLESGPLVAAVRDEAAQAIDLATTFALGSDSGLVLPVEREVDRAMRSAAASARGEIQRAVRLLEQANTPVQVQTALAVAQRSSGAVATGAEYAINSAANSAPRRIAVRLGQKLVWVAERDACVVCLALSGDVVDPNEGEAFDELATFGKPGSAPSVWPPGLPLLGPPRHPHCRCMAQVWNGSIVPGFLSWPQRLKHEALRSVLKGWSLPSESKAVRLAAAERILRNGQAGQLPKSVQEEGWLAVGRREFRSRDVPRYRPPGRTSVR